MSVTLTDVLALVRNIIEDNSTSMIPGDIFTYTSSSVFTLTESNVISVTAVFKNDVTLGSGEYSYDADTNQLTVSASLSSSDTVEIQYTYYPDYSDTTINNAIRAVLVRLSITNYYDFEEDGGTIYPEPSTKETRLLAMLTSIVLEPDNTSYRLPDITINVPKGSLPTEDRIRKTISIFKHNTHGIFDLLG